MKITSTLKRIALAMAAPAAFLALGLTAQATNSSSVDFTGTVYPCSGSVELLVTAPSELAGTTCDFHHATMGYLGSMTLMPGENYFWAPMGSGTYYSVGQGDYPNEWDPEF